ncbi:MAG: flagellar basal body-associated FliL family protein [Sphingobium sp.]|nr:flagellar basal body-associated FliL family protein [Sphingobium sp.]MCP5400697.1 flagellar basal body-associated FliL family protein [Sphingomonas sp.]
MSDEIEEVPKKDGMAGKMILIAAVGLVMSSAGIAGGLFAAGAFGSSAEEVVQEDTDKPQLVLEGEDPVAIAEAAAGEGSHEGKKGKKPKKGIDLPRPKDISKYQATYFQMPAPYTSNVADTDSLVQISIAVSTYYDNRVLEAVKTHETAMRSEILMMLAQQNEMELSTPKGKEALQKRLTSLINTILKEKTGYSGVDNVYFTNFVIQ